MARVRYAVDVTQEDIDRAKRNDSYRCVVVQALARTIPQASSIRVDTQTIRFRVGDERLQYLTPNSAAQYVVDFDAGDKIGTRFCSSCASARRGGKAEDRTGFSDRRRERTPQAGGEGRSMLSLARRHPGRAATRPKLNTPSANQTGGFVVDRRRCFPNMRSGPGGTRSPPGPFP
jgi:hypothetical protein